MLFRLSIKNIKKSVKDYAIYFFTLILGVAVFYVFNAIDSSTAMMNINTLQRDIIKLMNTMLGSISIFVSFVLGFLIIYASQFLIKRRKKEFGIYMLLGMSKKDLSQILLFETLLIGLISLVVGLVVGVFASQFMSILVANMFEAKMDKFVFSFSMEAMIKTIVFFAIIYLFVMLFNTFSISKCKLINLLTAAKQGERVKVKNKYVSLMLFVISIGLLGYAYYNVTTNGVKIPMGEMGYMIILGCVGTLLFFYSFSGIMLKVIQSNKKMYLKNLNMFVVRQLNSKVNTTVISMSIISIMLFLTICILSSGLSLKEMTARDLKEMTPVDLNAGQIINIENTSNPKVFLDQNGNPDYSEKEYQLAKNSIIENLDYLGFDAKQYLKDTIEYNVYAVDTVKLKSTLANSDEELNALLKEDYQFLAVDLDEQLMRISDYNKIAKLYGIKQYTLNENEYIMLCDYDNMVELRNEGLKNKPMLNVNGKHYAPKYDTCQDGFVAISNAHTNAGIVLLPDEALEDKDAVVTRLVANYNADNKEEYDAIDKMLVDGEGLNDERVNELNRLWFYCDTKSAIYVASVGIGAIGTFIGIYLGIIFLVSSAAILALKELSDSSDNVERYAILRKIGVDERMINKALFIQIGVFFLLPVLVAVVHSIFGINFCVQVLVTVGKTGLLSSILMCALFISLIYGGYFLITYFCSKNIIREK